MVEYSRVVDMVALEMIKSQVKVESLLGDFMRYCPVAKSHESPGRYSLSVESRLQKW